MKRSVVLVDCVGIYWRLAQNSSGSVLCRAKEEEILEGCLRAFRKAAVYFGGPHDLNDPGLTAGHQKVVHYQ